MIIGTTDITLTKETGTFHCPNCDELTPYRHRNVVIFLTFYFIPLIPIKSRSQYVECSQCRQTSEPEMLELSVEQIRASSRKISAEVIRRVLVVIVAVDHQVTDDELAVVQRFASENGLTDVSREQILREAAAVQETDVDWINYIHRITQPLHDDAKDQLIFYAFLAATADGALSETRQMLLKNMPGAIGVTEERFRAVVANAVEQS